MTTYNRAGFPEPQTKIIKKRTRTYPNGAIINFMKWKLCSQHSSNGHWAYYWKKGDLCWIDNDLEDGSVDLVYFKKENDNLTNEEINELLKKQVKFFRAFYKQSKNIVLKDWETLRERFRKLKTMTGDDFKEEKELLIYFFQAYWIEHDSKDGLYGLQEVMKLKK